jgi:hypothetical protein
MYLAKEMLLANKEILKIQINENYLFSNQFQIIKYTHK